MSSSLKLKGVREMSNALLDRDLILLNQTCQTVEEVLETIAAPMQAKQFAKETYADGLKEREQSFATGIPTEPFGVAIPHTDASYVLESKIGLLTLKEPVSFGVMGSENDQIDVKVVLLLGLADGSAHLKALQTIVERIQDAHFVKKLASVQEKDEALALLDASITKQLEGE
ncbi:hypothetical protein CHH59_17030 [Shouchella clausii]|nr:hypothetical protein CHH73_10465 [Shouchella clausii]PAD47917.1 hypothetical protein CHI09_04445 [Shouchella clausii]PAE81005.1 hypothetical protein CHH77_15235 [Shouchella clausii]PAF12777.1 hypothetical protein CHH59_17030 [Shouchella clausii]